MIKKHRSEESPVYPRNITTPLSKILDCDFKVQIAHVPICQVNITKKGGENAFV